MVFRRPACTFALPTPRVQRWRFVQTSLREWAYARAYGSSNERAAHLPVWLHRYNWHRPQAASAQNHQSADSSKPETTCLGSSELGFPEKMSCRRSEEIGRASCRERV